MSELTDFLKQLDQVLFLMEDHVPFTAERLREAIVEAQVAQIRQADQW